MVLQTPRKVSLQSINNRDHQPVDPDHLLLIGLGTLAERRLVAESIMISYRYVNCLFGKEGRESRDSRMRRREEKGRRMESG
jgi:hypothetical protein